LQSGTTTGYAHAAVFTLRKISDLITHARHVREVRNPRWKLLAERLHVVGKIKKVET
jgi:hypothetical protein